MKEIDERKPTVLAPEAKVMVRVENITKDYGHFRALDGISFEVKQGEVLGLLGPNGAGKTTAMRVLTGFFPPTLGKVWIHDLELFKNPKRVKRHIGYLPETIVLYGDMRVREYLKFVASIKGVQNRKAAAHIDEKLTHCGLWKVKNRMVGKLSKGFRQRVGLAQALIGDPEVLVLDEPTSGLDPKQIIEIRQLIRELGRDRTLILSTHILPEVSMVCDRVLIINQGRAVASGTTEELEAGLKDRQEVYIIIKERYRKEEAMGLLKSLSGVERIAAVDEKGDQVAFSMSVSKGRDLRPIVSKLLVERGIQLLEVRSGRLSLEEIFMKIVVNEDTEQPES